MLIDLIVEYNENGHLIYVESFPGAYVRGRTREEALLKLPSEIRQYCRWLNLPYDPELSAKFLQEKYSELQICDADSDIIFDSEKAPLSEDEYTYLKELALKSARDFHTLYMSIPDKANTVLSPRKTFYGDVPITAEAMYMHTKSVNSYYFGEINIDASNEPDIYTCRASGFEALEACNGFLTNTVYDGSYGEQWSLRKMCRRFIWHDRIHAKAMYKMAVKLCGSDSVQNPFFFEVQS